MQLPKLHTDFFLLRFDYFPKHFLLFPDTEFTRNGINCRNCSPINVKGGWLWIVNWERYESCCPTAYFDGCATFDCSSDFSWFNACASQWTKLRTGLLFWPPDVVHIANMYCTRLHGATPQKAAIFKFPFIWTPLLWGKESGRKRLHSTVFCD
jgi:hypothetical protein